MAKASDNAFPSLLITEGTEPAAPAAGKQRLYIDSTTHLLKRTDSSGTDVTIESIAAATDGWNSTSGFSYASADSPTFVITTATDLTAVIPVGARIKLTQTTAKYFLVTAITSSTITVYGGTDYTLANAAITTPFWSLAKAPLGFPLDPAKWTVTATHSSNSAKTSPATGTWYGDTGLSPTGPSGSIPIGIWLVTYQILIYMDRTSSAAEVYGSLSTSASSSSDSGWDAYAQMSITGATGISASVPVIRTRSLTLTSKTTYYLIVKQGFGSSGVVIQLQGAQSPSIIRAVSLYL